ncbi:hypothetical protein M413DRAFT_124194 [Hebeloma cylindrosporum]|uniref:Uncharacterized protein n=1 Tax=Hebeloma cylindrosporum TaxID=76867 RepID=A0A0C3CGS2_HEBCY|nr:hypothetical protein M413DRAFT_124194 [Hebeloma cylindrosporum h7]
MKLFLYGGIRMWDMDSKILSIRWMPHQCGPSYGAPKGCAGLQTDMLFFTDGDALGIPSFNESNAALDFKADWQGFLHYGFEQSLNMDALEATRSGQINLFGSESDDLYPFDWYRIQSLVAAVSPATNQTVPVVGASIFNPDQSQWKAYTEYRYLDDLNGQATKLTVFITMKRRVIVKIAAFLILIFNWLVTASLLYMTVVNVIGRREPPVGVDIVALTFSGLFALPSVRSVMPGNPPFGCLIDFLGILPNLMIIAGCATSFLISRLHREPRVLYPPHGGTHSSPKSFSNNDLELEQDIPRSEDARIW